MLKATVGRVQDARSVQVVATAATFHVVNDCDEALRYHLLSKSDITLSLAVTLCHITSQISGYCMVKIFIYRRRY